MEFVLGRMADTDDNGNFVTFYTEQEAFSGVHKIANKVRRDVQRVTDVLPGTSHTKDELGRYPVIYGTVGRSPILEDLHQRGLINLAQVMGKWEVYLFQLVESPFPGVESALIIAGSDKRGTIYGLFHLSLCIGVSPLVDWSDVMPAKQGRVVLTEDIAMVSRTPSVKYRGLFINDEWPAFGHWTSHRFGGFNAQMYDHVFELILRHKGNYLWPAMWTSNFSVDGPGLESAELADEYGIVIGTSHHEPCIRHGEEYSLLRGEDSIYGDAWDFRANRDGILRFWRDGLKRNGKLENIITLGMRGERDTPILERGSALADNIHLLRDIIREQNALIKELVNPNLTSVPRLLVLFTEVEAFFFGDEVTPGLLGDPELDGVTLMLCDDNFGNLRTLPDEKMRQHPGGYGLYYHLDFHGGPVSHEWVNASHLPKMWEQLTMAYEYGIRDVWVVNVGDISLLEFPLSYFFDLAYDMERWGIHAPNTTDAYTREWVDKQFLGSFSEEDRVGIYDIIDGYTRLNHNRKPEVMNSTVYHPVHFGEAESVLLRAGRIMEEADRLKSRCPGEALPAFYELVYFPAVASANVQRMQVLATRNEFYAKQGRAEANDYANEVAACIVRDRELTDELHSIGDGKWNGMGLSEHIGFVHWNEEGCRYPLMVRIEPANKPRIIVGPSQSTQATEGGSWTGKELVVSDFLRADVEDVNIDIACGSRQSVDYEVTTTCPWIRLSHERGSVRKKDVLTLHVDRSLVSGRQSGSVVITAPSSQVRLLVEVENLDIGSLQPLTFVESDGYICIEAEHFSDKHDVEDARFVKLEGYGRTKSGMKVMPPTYDFTTAVDRPYLEYRFLAARTGDYVVHFHLAPSNPATMDRRLAFGIQVNDGEVEIQNAVSDDFVPLNRCREWAAGVLENIRHCKATVPVREGENRLRFYAGSPLIVLEKMVLHPTTTELAASYLGPTESFYKKA